MSAIGNITVFDGASTPVSHTLAPISVTREKGVVEALWREQVASLPVNAQVRVTARLEKLKSGVSKAEYRVVVPVMESIGSQNAAGYTAPPKVAYENTLVITGYFHERSDINGRRLAKQIACNLLNNVSTSVTAATSGPMPELIDLLVSPT